MSKHDDYKKLAMAAKRAKAWHDLPNSKERYQGDSFKMSPAHGNIKLVRCGQHYQGGTNYWDSPKELNDAMLHVIANDPSVICKAIERMDLIAHNALVECEKETVALLNEINAAKGAATK